MKEHCGAKCPARQRRPPVTLALRLALMSGMLTLLPTICTLQAGPACARAPARVGGGRATAQRRQGAAAPGAGRIPSGGSLALRLLLGRVHNGVRCGINGCILGCRLLLGGGGAAGGGCVAPPLIPGQGAQKSPAATQG